MSSVDGDPVRPPQARKIISGILDTGSVIPSKHFREEAEKDQLDIVDAENVLRCGVVREPEWENGSWRYQVETPRIRVVIVFETETELILVTIMRLRP